MRNKLKRDIKKVKQIITEFLKDLEKGKTDDCEKLLRSLEVLLIDEYQRSNRGEIKTAYLYAEEARKDLEEFLKTGNLEKKKELEKSLMKIVDLEEKLEKGLNYRLPIPTDSGEAVRKEEMIEFLKNEVKVIHYFNPKYIFLTETSSIPNGYAIKEAWKIAYPKDSLPKFYRINARGLWRLNYSKDEKDKTFVEKFFKKRIKDFNARILVYDEWPDPGNSMKIVANTLRNPEEFGYSSEIKCPNITIFKESSRDPPDIFKMIYRDLYSRGKWSDEENGKTHEKMEDLFHSGRAPLIRLTRTEPLTIKPKEDYSKGVVHPPPIEKRSIDKGLRGVIIGNKIQVKYYKEIGKEVGRRIRDELKEEKD